MSIRILRGEEADALEVAVRRREAMPPPVPPTKEIDPAPESDAPSSQSSDSLERAYQEGFNHARQMLATEYDQKFALLTEQVGTAVCTLARERPRLRMAAEADVVKLSLAIARRVIRRDLSVDPAAIQGIVRVALDSINMRDLVRVRVHAELLVPVQNKLQECKLSHVEVRTDPSFGPGDIIFQTDQGELDCSIEAQLKEIDLGIADRLGR